MKKTLYGALLFVVALVASSAAEAQTLKRTTTKTDKFEFRSGGTVTIAGAPNGSITVRGSREQFVEITAEIELQAATEADLAKLAEVTGFITTESISRTGIVTIGTFNKGGQKRLPKKFPKHLLGLPFRVDYTITVPQYCDIEIDGGKGDLHVSGVEGAMRLNLLEGNANLELIGGSISGTFGTGNVEIVMGVNGWRARVASFQLASGTMRVRFPPKMSADLDATILRTGTIENGLTDLKPRDRKVAFTDKSIFAKAGVGGVPLKFTVGDGTLKLEPFKRPG